MAERILVMWKDEMGLTRAWGAADNVEDASEEANRQKGRYLAKNPSANLITKEVVPYTEGAEVL